MSLYQQSILLGRIRALARAEDSLNAQPRFKDGVVYLELNDTPDVPKTVVFFARLLELTGVEELDVRWGVD